jgi:hypothetical protein
MVDVCKLERRGNVSSYDDDAFSRETGRRPKGVIRVVLAIARQLPVHPDKRTISAFVGMSQRCHYGNQATSEQTIALARLRFVSAGPNATPLPLLDRRQ